MLMAIKKGECLIERDIVDSSGRVGDGEVGDIYRGMSH